MSFHLSFGGSFPLGLKRKSQVRTPDRSRSTCLVHLYSTNKTTLPSETRIESPPRFAQDRPMSFKWAHPIRRTITSPQSTHREYRVLHAHLIRCVHVAECELAHLCPRVFRLLEHFRAQAAPEAHPINWRKPSLHPLHSHDFTRLLRAQIRVHQGVSHQAGNLELALPTEIEALGLVLGDTAPVISADKRQASTSPLT